MNTYTSSVQRYANVAMDASGDFVVAWQSLQANDQTANKDDSGYGIYAQRFNSAGQRLGGANEIQTISFVDNWTGTFRLHWDNDNNPLTADLVTAPITYSGNTSATAYAIQSALSGNRRSGGRAARQLEDQHSLLRHVGRERSGSVKGHRFGQNRRSLKQHVQIDVNQEGNTGEFRVNDTTAGNQTFPSIGMDKQGNFVISWTSEGQGGDSAYNTNVYAKRYAYSGAFLDPNGFQVTSSTNTDISPIAGLQIQPTMTTVDDPNNHVVTADAGYSGVVQVMIDVGIPTFPLQGGYGSGTLLAGTNFILTAAHVVTFSGTNIPIPAQFLSIRFDTPNGPVYERGLQVFVHPGWTGNLVDGNDVALIELDSMAPAGVQGFSIYHGTDEIGKVGDFYGYGTIGTGLTGNAMPSGNLNDANDLKRHGENTIDATSSIFGISDTFLIFDFDDGTSQHDALGTLFNIHNLGLGVDEAMGSPGDSGGPIFINNQIAGVASFYVTFPGPQDVLPGLNASYGEMFGETRISTFADWVDTMTNYSGGEFLVNQDTVTRRNANGTVAASVNNTSNDQKWSSVALDADGDFVISWTSFGHDGVGNGYGDSSGGQNGIYARRFNAHATALPTGGVTYAASDVFQVNTFAQGDQQYSHVAIDAAGDFVITWESYQSVRHSGSQPSDMLARRWCSTRPIPTMPPLHWPLWARMPFMAPTAK